MTKKRGKKRKGSKKKPIMVSHKALFYVLLIMCVSLLCLNVVKAQGLLIPSVEGGAVVYRTVDISKMTIEEKVAQMVVVGGLKDNYYPWRNMRVGGIHLFALPTEHIFNNTIIDFQYGMDIPFFVTADLEGCVHPFLAIRNFTSAHEVTDPGEAFKKGVDEGRYLNGLGFNLNFAPVVDLDDQIWECRAWPGSPQEIAELAEAYALGLQTNDVIATIKHYPGKTLVAKDPHKFIVSAEIEQEDLDPYDYFIAKNEVEALMVTHVISTGLVDSGGIPAVVNKRIIDDIKKEYDGLIISDEIHMLGLKDFYESIDDMYIAVYAAGNDIILNFDRDPYEVYRMVQVVSDAVRRGEIAEEQIDQSVRKILLKKGFVVKN